MLVDFFSIWASPANVSSIQEQPEKTNDAVTESATVPEDWEEKNKPFPQCMEHRGYR